MPANTSSPPRASGARVQNGGQSESTNVANDFQVLVEDVGNCISQYSNKHPGVTAGAIFFLGFYLGWKIKPW